jgi:hypothetical protein
MNSTGEMVPCSGWRQRSSASRPATVPLASSIFGWNTRCSSFLGEGARSWVSSLRLR